MKSSEALKKARKLIEGGDALHVCYALSSVNEAEDTGVQHRLFGMFGLMRSLSDYWREQGKRELSEEINPYQNQYTARDYRLAWIDWMIEGYTAAGD